MAILELPDEMWAAMKHGGTLEGLCICGMNRGGSFLLVGH
jgi:hypothetical protein